MALEIAEWFGFLVGDGSPGAEDVRKAEGCPFIGLRCTKRLGDGSRSGVCAVKIAGEATPVIICPNRLYSQNYSVLTDVSKVAFNSDEPAIHPNEYPNRDKQKGVVVAFGKNFGGELKLPSRKGSGNYFVDWILARVNTSGNLIEFVAVEVQSVDITGTYRPEVIQLRGGETKVGKSKAGLNWENVNKRILPQLIYKGQVLRREGLCTKGLFFVCPSAVYARVQQRLGEHLLSYENLQPGSISFMHYRLADAVGGSQCALQGRFSTTVDQVAQALSSTTNLPPQGVYEEAINRQLVRLSN